MRIANILKRAQPAPCRRRSSRYASGRSSIIWRAANCAKARKIIRLTDREREMLRILAATPGETVPRMSLAGNGGAVSERAVDVQVNRLAPQDRAQSRQPAVRADSARHRLPAGDHIMTSLDIGNGVRTALMRLREAWEWYDALPPVRRIHSALGAGRRRLAENRAAGSTASCRRASTPARCSSSLLRW